MNTHSSLPPLSLPVFKGGNEMYKKFCMGSKFSKPKGGR